MHPHNCAAAPDLLTVCEELKLAHFDMAQKAGMGLALSDHDLTCADDLQERAQETIAKAKKGGEK